MATALVLVADGRRENGRWKRGSVVNPESGISDGKTWQNLLNQAGLVIDHRPELASEVVNGHYSLNAALILAEAGRRENGRWKRGSVDIGSSANIGWHHRIKECGLILDYRPELASEVINGHYSLNAAGEWQVEARLRSR